MGKDNKLTLEDNKLTLNVKVDLTGIGEDFFKANEREITIRTRDKASQAVGPWAHKTFGWDSIQHDDWFTDEKNRAKYAKGGLTKTFTVEVAIQEGLMIRDVREAYKADREGTLERLNQLTQKHANSIVANLYRDTHPSVFDR